MYKVSQKFYQWEVTQKVRKGEQLLLHVTCCLNLIYIAIKFHLDISYYYQVMVCTKIVGKKKIIKGSTSETKKGRAIIFVCDTCS